MIGSVCGPIGRSMPSLIVGVARPADPDDPAVLDPDVGLDDPDGRVDDDDAGDHDVELGWPGRGVGLAPSGGGRSWRSPTAARRPDAWRVAPRPAATGRCRRAGPGRRWWARSERGSRPRERRVTVRPRRIRSARRTGRARRPAVSPGAQRTESPAGRSRRNPVAAARSNVEPGVRPARTGSGKTPARPARDRFSTVIVRRSPARRQFDVRVGETDLPGLHSGSPSGSVGPSGSTSTISRVPSPRRTSSRTSSSRSRTPSISSSSRTAVRPARSTPARVRAGAGGLEHRVADEGHRLGMVQRQAGRPMATSQLGGGEDEEPLLFPWGQAHRHPWYRRAHPSGDRPASRRRRPAAGRAAGSTGWPDPIRALDSEHGDAWFRQGRISRRTRAEVPSGLVNQAAKRSNWQPPACSRPRRLGGKVSVEAASSPRAVEASFSGDAHRVSVT